MPKAKTKTTDLAVPDMETLMLPPSVELLEDNAQYTNRFDFPAASGNIYRVAQSKSGRWWACSCPSWIHKAQGNRHCKHLRDFGLPADYQSFEVGQLQLTATGTPAPAIGAVPMPTSKRGKALAAAKSGGKALAAKGPAAKTLTVVEAPALPAAVPVPGCKPKSVSMIGDEIVVTFDAKDSAAVFALLAQITGGNG
jgi:hypothetical protein